VRWSVNQGPQEELTANNLALSLQNGNVANSPRLIFQTAIAACREVAENTHSYDWPGQGDVLCAALTCHNVLRALGRRNEYIDQTTGVDYAPDWLKNNESYWEGVFAPMMQQSMLPLRNDGGGDGWGEWYHTFGLLTYGMHQSALFGVEVRELLKYSTVKFFFFFF
jgi:hypothetical protein